MVYTLQKSFRLESGRLVTLKSGRPIESLQVTEDLSQDGFAATTSVNYWISILGPDALCSFATDPGVRAIIHADKLLSRRGAEVIVPSYSIVAFSADYPEQNTVLRKLFTDISIFDSPDDLRRTFRVTTRREARQVLRNLKA